MAVPAFEQVKLGATVRVSTKFDFEALHNQLETFRAYSSVVVM